MSNTAKKALAQKKPTTPIDVICSTTESASVLTKSRFCITLERRKAMSKIAEEKAMGAWAIYEYREHPKGLYHTCFVDGYKEGYEQAEKDIISHIREQIERWMPKDNGEEHIKGERTAFNSVLHLLKEMEEE